MKKSKIFFSTSPYKAEVKVGEKTIFAYFIWSSPTVKVGDTIHIGVTKTLLGDDYNIKEKIEYNFMGEKTSIEGVVLSIEDRPSIDDENWVYLPSHVEINSPINWDYAKGLWVIVPLSYITSKVWRKTGRSTYLNAFTIEEYRKIDTGRRIIDSLKVYNSKAECLRELFS